MRCQCSYLDPSAVGTYTVKGYKSGWYSVPAGIITKKHLIVNHKNRGNPLPPKNSSAEEFHNICILFAGPTQSRTIEINCPESLRCIYFSGSTLSQT